MFGTTFRQAWDWSIAALGEIADKAAEFDVTLVIEPVSFDSNLVDKCHEAIEMMEEVNKPNVKLMFDTFHVLYRKRCHRTTFTAWGKTSAICTFRIIIGSLPGKDEETLSPSLMH